MSFSSTCLGSRTIRSTLSARRLALLCSVVLSAVVSSVSTRSAVADSGTLTLKFGPGVYHWSSSPEHNNRTWLVGAAWEYPSGWNVGGAAFRNSFGQPSQYLYVGKRWFPAALPDPLYLNVTGGLLFGYKEPYRNKIPLNHSSGIAPAVLPALGYQHKRSNVQLIPLGTAGVIMTFGLDI